MENEEIKKLFEQFMESEKAQEAADDISFGDRLLGRHPGPEPDEKLISEVRAAIRVRLAEEQAKTKRLKIVFKAAAIAAVLAILSFVGSILLDQKETGPIQVTGTPVAESIWEGDDIFAGDKKLTALDAEIEQIQNELSSLELGENGGNGNSDLFNIETDLIEVAGDFWEG
jgi:hypothetical protein